MTRSRLKASVVLTALAICVAFAGWSGATAKQGKAKLAMSGMYVEGCSCAPPCPCELTGLAMGCEGVGGFAISQGSFDGAKLDGLKFAYATVPGEWITCYVDAKNAEQRKAGEALCKAAFGAWGKMSPVKDAKIEITGKDGKYKLTVDGGKIMDLTTEPVLGGDKKSPIVISNINSVLHPVVLQAKTIKCTYNDEGKSFTIEDCNAYFNNKLKAKGEL